MKTFKLVPEGWPCKLINCRPGLFLFQDELCFKSDYMENGHIDVYICDGGSAFWGGNNSFQARDNLIVQPVESVWSEEE